MPWYITGGFQDWLGNASAEREMTAPAPARWQYPSLWHSLYVTVPLGTLEIFMVDTVTLTGVAPTQGTVTLSLNAGVPDERFLSDVFRWVKL